MEKDFLIIIIILKIESVDLIMIIYKVRINFFPNDSLILNNLITPLIIIFPPRNNKLVNEDIKRRIDSVNENTDFVINNQISYIPNLIID